jgi:hypothetical protein
MHDHSRPITKAEEAFFSKCGTGRVPVIAIFTKFDALHTVAFSELTEQGMGSEEALALAPQQAGQMFKDNDYYGMLQDE